MENSKVKDLGLAPAGKLRIEWAESRMPVLMALREKHQGLKSLKGMRVAGCLHVTKETAVLVKTLVAAGAEISWSGCNPLSTQDDVAAALASEGLSVYAWHGQSRDEFYWAIDKTLEMKPTLTLDDGADLIFRVHSTGPTWRKGSSAGRRRPPRECIACGPWGKRGNCSTPSSRSMTRKRNPTSTTSTARGNPLLTESCEQRPSCLPARTSLSPATDIAAAAWPLAPGGWGRAS